MERLLTVALALSLTLASSLHASPRHRVTTTLDHSVIAADSELPSWRNRGSGRLRFDSSDDGLLANRLFIEYRGALTGTVHAKLTANAFNGDTGGLDLTEAVINWRPVPDNRWRLRGRLGIFYPHLSLENHEAGWSNAYHLSNSVINSWLGDELRTIGGELKLARDIGTRREHQLSVEGAVFYFNDPAGAALAWRGWLSHDSQAGIFGELKTPAVSAIAPWNATGEPLPDFSPFQEIDHRPGFYAGAGWRWGERLMIRAMQYNNHANPEATDGPDYAWETWFTHVAAQAALPFGVGVLGQWIDGASRMGPDLGPWRVQDIDFRASFVTLTRDVGAHRVSFRYEWFDTQPFNDPVGVTNRDQGNAFAFAWLYNVSERLRIGAEYLQIVSDHCSNAQCFWIWAGQPKTTREDQVQLSLRWRFDGSRRPR